MGAYKERIAVMQMADVERLQQEIAYREELAENHGKPKAYWKVPALNTFKRQHVRQGDSNAAIRLRPLRVNKSQNPRQQQQRTNKYALDDNTIMLKKLLSKRKEELSKYLANASEMPKKSVFAGHP